MEGFSKAFVFLKISKAYPLMTPKVKGCVGGPQDHPQGQWLARRTARTVTVVYYRAKTKSSQQKEEHRTVSTGSQA